MRPALLLTIVMAACASAATEAPPAPAGEQPAPVSAGEILIARRAEGWSVADVVACVARELEVAIEPADARTQERLARRIDFVGEDVRIPREQALEWLQAVAAFHRLVLVPTGPPGRARYAVLARSDG